ncbi:MAG: SHOCT domain-containing protein [Dehalococcoidia bacterium]
MKERPLVEMGGLSRLHRYLLLGAAAIVIMAAALMPSVGLAASMGSTDWTARAVAQALQEPVTSAESADASGWAASLTADEGCCDDDHMWGWGGGWWWLIMPIGMIVFWGAIIALVVWAIRQLTEGRGGKGNALDIAEARYARGEISREEFEQIRRDLS